MTTFTDFKYSDQTEPHRIRTREILKAHPEIKKLIGKKNVNTFWITLFCVSLQIAMAFALQNQPWYIIGLAAYCVGAFAAHTLFVCIHDSAHNLVFRKVWMNVANGILANFPTLLPTAISFKNFHLKHHAFQGVHELDADLPDWYEAKLINNYSIGKAIWLFLFPVFQVIRTLRCKELFMFDKHVVANILVQLLFNVVIFYFTGFAGIAYLTLSFFLSVGLHPLGARWIQEHFLTFEGEQETFSYYGPLNTINLNVGYHNEHHDFPSISWNNLPKIKAIAPEYYETLHYHTSYTKLLFQFIFSQEISLYSRIMRKERGRVTLADQSKPDLELVSA